MSARTENLDPRGAKRIKTFERAEIAVKDVVARGHLLDVSVSGFKAHAEAPIVPASVVRLRGSVGAVSARVVWVSGNQFGAEFCRALNAVELDSFTST